MMHRCLDALGITKPVDMKRALSNALLLLVAVGLVLARQWAGFTEYGANAKSPRTLVYFVATGTALLLLAFGMLRLFRKSRMKTRTAIVREERERLARELHDTVIQGCTGISVLLEAIASAMTKGEAIQGDLLNCAREQARQTVDEARSAVWGLRQPEKNIDLVAIFQSLAAQMSCSAGSPVSLQHNVAYMAVPASRANDIVMTVREAIQNAVRHSGTERILVSLRSDRRGLRVSVRDYGCGLSSTTKPIDQRHFGIVGMRERMRQIGGVLQINDMSGAGTTVELMLRWGSLRNRTMWF